ncbi:olfactory receptor 287-like [Discoglossus pictus]
MAVVFCDLNLHIPMYFFICIFSFLEICYTSVTMPRLLRDLCSKDKIISVSSCITQFYFLFVFGSTENFLLSSMAYDRYVAICNPLRYRMIITPKTCMSLALGSWIGGFLAPILPATLLSMSSFCGSNQIDHFYCDFPPLLHLSCAMYEDYSGEIVFLFLACFVILGNFIFIGVSYSLVIAAISKIPSPQGRRRTFSTCASHLTVVSLFYGSIIFMYVRSDFRSPSKINKIVSLFYCAVTPTLNPLIYGLRNEEMKQGLRRTVKRYFMTENLFSNS